MSIQSHKNIYNHTPSNSISGVLFQEKIYKIWKRDKVTKMCTWNIIYIVKN